jgi:lipoprotein-anchoring transpeptidase ErfK/SrfK
MRADRYQVQVTEKKRRNSRAGKILILLIFAALFGAGAYKAYTSVRFPAHTMVNGVKVDKMTVEEAKTAIEASENTIELTQDGKKLVDAKTYFTYDITDSLSDTLMLASVDPRQMFGADSDYTIDLPVDKGIDDTAGRFAREVNFEAGMGDSLVYTEDAYVDLETLTIVDEVYGNNVDYKKLAKAIAAQRKDDPRKETFEYDSSRFVDLPDIKAGDLGDELAFDKENLVPGIELDAPDGSVVTLTTPQMGEVIKYSPEGAKYDEEGAINVAKEAAGDYYSSTVTLNTVEGQKTLSNYVLKDEVDYEATGKSILEAAKNKGRGTITVKKTADNMLGDHVEVSITNQTVYLVKGGEVVFQSPCVSGGPGHGTGRGVFSIAYKGMYVTLKGYNDDGSKYESPVTYWMPFNGGEGLHDATWRYSFGGSIYTYNGSHGCVNLPYDQAAILYNMVDAGMPVLVYD